MEIEQTEKEAEKVQTQCSPAYQTQIHVCAFIKRAYEKIQY